VSAVLVAGVFGVFRAALGAGADLDTARTAAVNTLVLFEVFYLFNVRRLRAPAWPGLWGTGSGACWLAVASVLAMQLAFTYLPPMQTLFRTRALGAADWLPILAVSASVFLVVEGEKLVWWPLRR
jgi:magnesium-transporting ATPase (P-type)